MKLLIFLVTFQVVDRQMNTAQMRTKLVVLPIYYV